MDRSAHQSRHPNPRPALSGVSLLVLDTLTVASSAAALEPVLAGLQDASAAAERQAVRLLPGSLAKAVGAGAGCERCSDVAQNPCIRVYGQPASQTMTPAATVDGTPRLLIRLALLDLPPPTA